MKLSIIIPVYNTEQYIEQCIESVLNIKGTENEIIIVNDGSTDRTPEILEKYEKNYSHIKIFTQENQGASMARNRGIKECTGDYIYFLDSDDWIETASFEKIIKNLEKDYEMADLDIDSKIEYAKQFFKGVNVTGFEGEEKAITPKIITGKEREGKYYKGYCVFH